MLREVGRGTLVVHGSPDTPLQRIAIVVASGPPGTLASHRAAAFMEQVDGFERRGHSLTWLEQTAQRLHRPGQRGTGLVLAEVKRRRQRGRVRDSWFERLLEECCRSPRLPPVFAQYELRDQRGLFIARFDLAFPQVRLAIEAHSRAFHTGAHREAADERRDIRASLAGWDVKYFGYQDVSERPNQTRRTIEQLVNQRARDLGLTRPGPRSNAKRSPETA